MSQKHWLPLEANPDVLNRFLRQMGVANEQHSFVDVYGLDPDLLSMVPKPVLAVLLLFPISSASEEARIAQDAGFQAQSVPSDLYFLKQTVSNACGTIALMHAVGNNRNTLNLEQGSFFANFFAGAETEDAEQRAKKLEASDELERVHMESAQSGQSEVPSLETPVDLHFIAFVQKDGTMWELDGRKAGPVNHGHSSPETVLEDAAAVIQREFVARDPDSVQFTMVALVDTSGASAE
jgi:ubiquitin carboxyl-terminal hydrolase L3